MPAVLLKDSLMLEEHASAPGTPIANHGIIYPKADGRWYSKDDAGVEREMFMDLGVRDYGASVNLTGVTGLEFPLHTVEDRGSNVAGLKVLPRADARNIRWLQAENGGYQYVGTAAYTSSGTLAASGDVETLFTQNTSAAVTINTAYGLISASAFAQTRWDPTFIIVMKTGPLVTSVRHQFGLFSAAPSLTSDTINPTHSVFFRYSTNASDTTWQLVTSNASGMTVTDTTVPVAIDSLYILRVQITGNGALVTADIATSIGGAFSTPVSTALTLPTNSQALSVYLRHVNAAAATRIHKMGRFYIEMN